jgi:hypothetical protein
LRPAPGTPRQEMGGGATAEQLLLYGKEIAEGNFMGPVGWVWREGPAREARPPPATALCTHAPEDGGREAPSWVVHFIAEKRISPCATDKVFRRARFARGASRQC